MAKISPFEQAFANARKEYLAGTGPKNFTFNGKLYNTNLANEGLKKTEDIQKSTDALPSMGRQSGPLTATQGATYPKPQASEKSLLDKYRESDTAKGFRDARATFGNTPSTDMLMKAGQVGIGMEIGKLLGPAGSAVGAVVKRALKKDSPAASVADDIKDPSFNPEKMVDRSRSEPAFNPDKMVDRRSTTFPGRTEQKFNPERMTGRDQPDPMKKGGAVKQYAKGGRINLDACGVSTHISSKKNPNF